MLLEKELTATDPKTILTPQVQEVLKKYTSRIPQYLMGPDRVSFLIDGFSEISREDRGQLIEVMNGLLKVMVDREASDIELGGYGSEGHVWLRVYGKKEPVLELPNFTA